MSGIVSFGRYEDQSLTQVVLQDPDWFCWAWEQNAFDRDPGLLVQAHELYYKARNIKIPRPNPEEWQVRYFIHRNGKFERFDIVQAASRDWDDASQIVRDDRLDLSFPRQLSQYDKLGGRLLLGCFKHYFLGNPDARLTRRWCDEFFANRNNFLEPRQISPIHPVTSFDDLRRKSAMGSMRWS
jgi:hypothetical protein